MLREFHWSEYIRESVERRKFICSINRIICFKGGRRTDLHSLLTRSIRVRTTSILGTLSSLRWRQMWKLSNGAAAVAPRSPLAFSLSGIHEVQIVSQGKCEWCEICGNNMDLSEFGERTYQQEIRRRLIGRPCTILCIFPIRLQYRYVWSNAHLVLPL